MKMNVEVLFDELQKAIVITESDIENNKCGVVRLFEILSGLKKPEEVKYTFNETDIDRSGKTFSSLIRATRELQKKLLSLKTSLDAVA